jgi:hypothetical protein
VICRVERSRLSPPCRLIVAYITSLSREIHTENKKKLKKKALTAEISRSRKIGRELRNRMTRFGFDIIIITFEQLFLLPGGGLFGDNNRSVSTV